MKKTMYIAAALLVLVGCNKKENVIENTPQEIVTIKGGIALPQTPNKIAAPEGWESETDPFTMLWEEGDKIYIYNEGDEANRQEYTLTAGDGTNDGTFTGTPLQNMSNYKVAYGYDPQSTSIEYNVPYIEDNYRPFAEGTGVNYDFTIADFGPVIGLQLKGKDALTKIKVVLSNDHGTVASYTMVLEDALALSTESVTKVYFPIRAKEGMAEMAISFYKAGIPEDILIMTKTTGPAPEVSQVTTYPELEVKAAPNHDFVDLGLPSSRKWATYNVGATKPEEYGDYFAWGETEPYYDALRTQDIKWNKIYGYCWQSYCGYNFFSEWSTPPYDASTNNLKPEFDAATANWGDDWRMPTMTEIMELESSCTWEWTDNYNSTGVAGYTVKSNAEGNTNSIFLPAANSFDGTSLKDDRITGCYWSFTVDDINTDSAYRLSFNSEMKNANKSSRYLGFSVRPVYCGD